MPKEWVLNMATNRWGLNKKRSVGPVAQWIREVAPRDVNEWEKAYYERLTAFLKAKGISQSPQEYLRTLGERLFIKISEVLRAEIEAITLDDCIAYIHHLVIHRTFEGYRRELETIYGQLQTELGYPIEPASDEIDRRYQVDFLIPIGPYRIGLQLKPITYMHMNEVHQWLKRMETAHQRFQRRFGGRVFVVFSQTQGRQKRIANPEVIDEIRAEIQRLQSLLQSTP